MQEAPRNAWEPPDVNPKALRISVTVFVEPTGRKISCRYYTGSQVSESIRLKTPPDRTPSLVSGRCH